jgi:hypothetical protein
MFTSENVAQARRLLPVERHDGVVTAVVVKARKPG